MLCFFLQEEWMEKLEKGRGVPAWKEDKKLSITHCRKVLNRNGNNHSDEQIQKIRDFLYFIAEMEYENFKNNKPDI